MTWGPTTLTERKKTYLLEYVVPFDNTAQVILCKLFRILPVYRI